MPATDVIQVLRVAKSHALRNATILDQISAPLNHSNPLQNDADVGNASSATATVASATTASVPAARVSSNSASATPISKHILTSIFATLDKSSDNRPANYASVENHFQNYFLYGLVLPLIARLLAVSSPGLLCVVQLPRSQFLPSWVTSQSPDEYPSNGSNDSKSAGATIPSSQATSKTPSRSDDTNGSDRKSTSLDGHPRTSDLIRRADAVLSEAQAASSGAEAATKIDLPNNNVRQQPVSSQTFEQPPSSSFPTSSVQNSAGDILHTTKDRISTDATMVDSSNKRNTNTDADGSTAFGYVDGAGDNITFHQKNGRQNEKREKKRNVDSRPADRAMHDHRALRLVCNGFEVLTGKMPPPRMPMAPFTLATIGWDKAGVISPVDSKESVSMSFSNGMMTPTEGLVVTFSNGSMVVLTLRDPFSVLQEVKTTEATPVVLFSFAPIGYSCLGDMLSKKASSLSKPAAAVRSWCDKSNVFLVEIGHGISPNNSAVDDPMDVSGQHGSQDERSEKRRQANANKTASVHKNLSRNGGHVQRGASCGILINAVPRAIPLFVNTINQTFIDGPYNDMGSGRLDDRYDSAINTDQLSHDGTRDMYSSYPPDRNASRALANSDSRSMPRSVNVRNGPLGSQDFAEGSPWHDGKVVEPYKDGGIPAKNGFFRMSRPQEVCLRNQTGREKHGVGRSSGMSRHSLAPTLTSAHSPMYGYYPYGHVYGGNSHHHVAHASVIPGQPSTPGAPMNSLHHPPSQGSISLHGGRHPGYFSNGQGPLAPAYMPSNMTHPPFMHGSYYHALHPQGHGGGGVMMHTHQDPYAFHSTHPQQLQGAGGLASHWDGSNGPAISHNGVYGIGDSRQTANPCRTIAMPHGPAVISDQYSTAQYQTHGWAPNGMHPRVDANYVPEWKKTDGTGIPNYEDPEVGQKGFLSSAESGHDKAEHTNNVRSEQQHIGDGDSADKEKALAALMKMRDGVHTQIKEGIEGNSKGGRTGKRGHSSMLNDHGGNQSDGFGYCSGELANGHKPEKRKNGKCTSHKNQSGKEYESDEDDEDGDDDAREERVNGRLCKNIANRKCRSSSESLNSQVGSLMNKTMNRPVEESANGYHMSSSSWARDHEHKKARQR